MRDLKEKGVKEIATMCQKRLGKCQGIESLKKRKSFKRGNLSRFLRKRRGRTGKSKESILHGLPKGKEGWLLGVIKSCGGEGQVKRGGGGTKDGDRAGDVHPWFRGEITEKK